MLNIKASNMAICAVNRNTGNTTEMGTVEVVSSAPTYRIDYDNTAFHFKNSNWNIGDSTITNVRTKLDNTISQEFMVNQLSIFDKVAFYLEPDTEYDLTWETLELKIRRNAIIHYRQEDTFIVRSEHKLIASPNRAEIKPCYVVAPNIPKVVNLKHEFMTPFPRNDSNASIYLLDAEGKNVNAAVGGTSSGYIDWLYDDENHYNKDNLNLWMFEISIGHTTGGRAKYIGFSNGSRGHWRVELTDEIGIRLQQLSDTTALRFRFVTACSPIQLIDAPQAIAPTFLDAQMLTFPSEVISATYSEDGLTGYFQLNHKALTSVYHNGVQLTNKLQTTEDGKFTVTFPTNVNRGSTISIRTSTTWPEQKFQNFELTVNDTVAPDPVTAILFTKNKIIGNGTVGDAVYAERDNIVIGQTNVLAGGQFIMVLNEGIELTTGETISLYTKDLAGNRSNPEVTEIEVAITTDGVFSPEMGNDGFAYVLV